MECPACFHPLTKDASREELVCRNCMLVVSTDGKPLEYGTVHPYRKTRSNPGPNTNFMYGELKSKNPGNHGSNHTGQLILSCPHAQCEIPKSDYNKHLCDWVAEEALMGILEHLGDEPNTKFIIGKDLRTIWDLNRKRSRLRPFRKALEKIIRPGDLHIDVHSYPDSDHSDNWHEYDFVLFKHGDEKLITQLSNAIKAAGFTVMVLPADRINDVANSSTELGANSCLIEFSSALKDNDKMDAASKAVAQGIISYRRSMN